MVKLVLKITLQWQLLMNLAEVKFSVTSGLITEITTNFEDMPKNLKSPYLFDPPMIIMRLIGK